MKTLHPYQEQTICETIKALLCQAGYGILADPGLGKTIMTLTAIKGLQRLGEVRRTLVVAPLRVVQTVWRQEAEDWGVPLSFSCVHGSARDRSQALSADADVYLVNPENTVWLERHGLPADLDFLVLDESTKFKNWSAKRSKSLRRLLKRGQFKKRLILTGTPSPNGLVDLFSQVYVLDDGEALGKTIGYFRAKYCERYGYELRQWRVYPRAQEAISGQIGHLVTRLDAKDHLDMPRLIENTIRLDVPSDIRREYKRLEKELAIMLADGTPLTASNAGAKYVMLRQLLNGGLYETLPDGRKIHHIHNDKVMALVDLHEELYHKPLLVAYQFQHDLERLRTQWPDAPALKGGMKGKEVQAIIDRWNTGTVPILFAQPQSVSHGLNLQAAGHDVAWYGLTDNLETYLQFNARVYRQGVKSNFVRIHHLIVRNSIDEVILERIKGKDTSQQALLEALKSRLGGKVCDTQPKAKS